MIRLKKGKKGAEPSELGFGTVATETDRGRLINRDGSFNVERRGLGFFSSLSIYHYLLNTSWPKFIAWASFGYFLMNLLFAFTYLLFGSAALEGIDGIDSFPEKLFQAFYFSVQTSSTIGYGHITPANNAANILVTLESFVGLLGIALVTGLVFARFSRPLAHILYSKNAMIGPYQEMTAFMFRIANGKKNQLIEVSAQLRFSFVVNREGESKREFHSLPLELEKLPFFPLTWTIVHPIDKESPLYGLNGDDLIEAEAEFLILLTGMDDTFNQTVFSRSSYNAEEVVYGGKFVRIFSRPEKQGPVVVDLDRLNEFERFDMNT